MDNSEQDENKKKPEETVPSLKERIERLKEENEFVEDPMKENIEKPEEVKKPKQ